MSKINRFQPDYLFVIPQIEKFPSQIYQDIKKKSKPIWIGFFGDDVLGFETFACINIYRKFDWIITTDHSSVSRYKKLGKAEKYNSLSVGSSVKDCARADKKSIQK